MRIKTDGNVGIGTGEPGDRLHVHAGNFRLTRGASWPLILEQSSASVFTIQNGGQVRFALEPDGLAAISRLRPLGSGEHDFGHVCLYPRFPPGATQSQGWYFSACGSAKEYVATIDGGAGHPEAGDLVGLAPTPTPGEGLGVVTKTQAPCDSSLLGVIAAGGADGHRHGANDRPLAIYGLFPVKVTLESGPIRRGDSIASSSKPGYGMKATQACRIVGYALEDASREGIIRVFVNLGDHAAPEVRLLRQQVETLSRDNEAMREAVLALKIELQRLQRAMAAVPD